MLVNGKIIAASGFGVVVLCGGSYVAGRHSVHPSTEIQYKERVVLQEDTKKEQQVIDSKVKEQVQQIVQQKTKELEESYKKRLNSESRGKVTTTTTTTIDSKTGIKTITETKTVDYDNKKNTNVNKKTNTKKHESTNTKTDTKEQEHKEVHKKEEEHKKEDKTVDEKIKQTYPDSNNGIDYTFLVGRSFKDPALDYMGIVGVPLPIFHFIKANVGFEWHDKRMFVGATINY